MPNNRYKSQKIVAYTNSKGELVIDTQYQAPKKLSFFQSDLFHIIFVVAMTMLFTVTFFIKLADSLDADAKRFEHQNAIEKMQQTHEVVK